MRRLVLSWLVLAVTCSSLVGLTFASVAASETGAPPMTTAAVRGTNLSINYPKDWLEANIPMSVTALRSYLKQYPRWGQLMGIGTTASDKDLRNVIKEIRSTRRFLAADMNGDGDNVVVSEERGPWWKGLGEWRTVAAMSARSTNSTVIDDGETTVGSHPAFWHLEQYPASDGGDYYGYMEVRTGKGRTVSIAITVDTNSRTTAEAIMHSVVSA